MPFKSAALYEQEALCQSLVRKPSQSGLSGKRPSQLGGPRSQEASLDRRPVSREVPLYRRLSQSGQEALSK